MQNAGGANSGTAYSFNPSYASLLASLLGISTGQVAVGATGSFAPTQVQYLRQSMALAYLPHYMRLSRKSPCFGKLCLILCLEVHRSSR